MSRLNGQDETAKAHKVSNIRAGTAGMLGSAWEHQSRGLGAISSLFPPAAPLFLQVSTRHQHQFPQPVYNPYPTQKTMYVAKHLKLEITLLFPLLIWPLQALASPSQGSGHDALAAKLSYLGKTAIYSASAYSAVGAACHILVPRTPLLQNDCKNLAMIAASGTAIARTYFEDELQGRVAAIAGGGQDCSKKKQMQREREEL